MDLPHSPFCAGAQRHPVVEEDLERIAARPLPWSRLDGRTVWVTGASGMIPAYVVELLLHLNEWVLDRPATVVGLVRNPDRARRRFAHYRGRDDLLLAPFAADAPAPGPGTPDFIVHGASQAGLHHYRDDPFGTLWPNVFGTQALLTAIAEPASCAGFLFLSSGAVHGELEAAVDPVPESRYGPVDPTDPLACYAMGKRMGEHLLACAHAQHGLRTLSARLGHTYGPGLRLEDERVFADFTRSLLLGEELVIRGTGRAQRPFCYLRDAVWGLMTILLTGQAGTAYSVVNNRAKLAIDDLAETLCASLPETGSRVARRASHARAETPQERGLTLDTSRLEGLGWQPEVGVVEGFARTLRSFRHE